MKNTVKIIIGLIPVIIACYLLYSNFLVNQEFNYLYDIGSKEDNYLSPAERVSGSTNETSGYRNLTGHLVYFDIPVQRDAEFIKIKAKFKDNFPENTKMSIGAKDKEEWSYLYKEAYNFESVHPKILGRPVNYRKEDTTISVAMRGKHTFYVYVEGDLDLGIQKQDINWYEGPDELNISVYDFNDNVVADKAIGDDGIINVDKSAVKVQQDNFKVSNLKAGVYRLEFSDFDGLIREIKINTNKIVTKKIFLANNKLYNLETKPSKLFINSSEQVKLLSPHKEGLQNISYDGKTFNFDTEDKPVTWDLKGEYTLTFPNNDIIVESKDWMSFSKETYFVPFTRDLTQNWITAETEFNIKTDNLTIKDNKLSLVFNIPHLSKEEYKNNTIPLDWIDVTVYKPGLFK